MKLYRFSPIKTKKELNQAIQHVHLACHQLCKQTVGEYLPVSGNIGIFCHYEDEYKYLTKIREELTDKKSSFNGKYFKLFEPIVIPAINDVPATKYTHLYVRHPDPYRYQVGDVDFYLHADEYQKLKSKVKQGEVESARAFLRPTEDMIELWDPDVDCLGYIVTWKMLEE